MGREAFNNSKPVRSNPFSCPTCKATFRTLDSLLEHKRGGHAKVQCPVCKEAFDTISELFEHRKETGHKRELIPWHGGNGI